ncbi:hypothetical protein DENIS_3040 [Desulfonema ishimotonii]|uniref:SnoaL-like domain-containing protein n=1 Tax=Desulfonema ishimotonii TaxID=45657 RepID=A0A401FYN9_9BACT|nr:nuclear transport factor 2 family protein [Desulfonema ishimotonii]GBC62077.1 hypothetical protein DENIS_3040 [Desulfonema ishimotonii]
MKRIVMLALTVFLMTAPFCVAEEPSPEVMAELEAFYKSYVDTVQKKDIDAMMKLWAPGPGILLMGTGPGERFLGEEAVREAHLSFFDESDKEEIKLTWHKANISGNTAWVANMAYITTYASNKKNEYALNWTWVLNKTDGKWLLNMQHYSNLYCNGEAGE